MRVLVVEDEPSLSRQLETALGKAGYVVDCADDGEKADFMGQTKGYDAVMLDLGLPKIDGLTLLRRWRDQGLSVPVVMLGTRGLAREGSRASTVAPTITSPSPFERRSCWRACAP